MGEQKDWGYSKRKLPVARGPINGKKPDCPTPLWPPDPPFAREGNIRVNIKEAAHLTPKEPQRYRSWGAQEARPQLPAGGAEGAWSRAAG